jgi:hypothetical protein
MHVVPTLWRRMRLVAALVLAIAIAVPAFGALTTSASAATPTLPCDIYAAADTPCEAAYSTTRALFASYDGPLYEVERSSDDSTLNIGLESTGGVVDSAPARPAPSLSSTTRPRTATTCPSRRALPVRAARMGSQGPARTARTSVRPRWRCR